MKFDKWVKPEIEDGKLTKYNWLVQHSSNLQLGVRTDIGAFTYINAKHGVIIEDDVQIGSQCSVYSVSTIDGRSGKVILKQNCKIGSHSTIMPGVTIGKNTIIGAHSFVNTSIRENTLAYGVPVRHIRDLLMHERG